MASRRLPAVLAVLLCIALCAPAARADDRQFLVTVLRSSDPLQIRELLGLQPVPGYSGRQREIRTSGYGRGETDRWQVIVGEGRPAYVASGGAVPRLRIPWIELTRRGPVPHVVPGWHDVVQGVRVQARQMRGGVEVQLDWFTGNTESLPESGDAGTGLSTVVRGSPGRWLDAGGTLLPEPVVTGARRIGTRHGDPRRFRILVRVDRLD